MAESNLPVTFEAPREIRFTEFVASRARELELMMRSAAAVKQNMRTMQQLPRHMRRRAASHDVRRLPLNLRLSALREMKKAGSPHASKRPSRRHRRRPANLLLDYARRRRKHVWLETHIWHAKRFHMVQRWGYKLALRSNERGVRAAYRSTVNRCLLLDMSYYCCIELSGPENDIISGLEKITSPSNGPTFAARQFIDGTREGKVTIFRSGQCPRSALGDVTFMWKSILLQFTTLRIDQQPEVSLESSGSESHTNNISAEVGYNQSVSRDCLSARRQLWLWTHCASYRAILEELKAVFALEKSLEHPTTDDYTEFSRPTSDAGDASSEAVEPPKKRRRKDEAKAEVESMSLSRDLWTNGCLTLESLKDELCRFKLIGPNSLAVLQAALRPATVERSDPSTGHSSGLDGQDKRDSGDKSHCRNTDAMCGSVGTCGGWWECYYAREEHAESVREQGRRWSEMMTMLSPAELAPHSIHALIVRDPRFFLPRKKTKAIQQNEVLPCASQQWMPSRAVSESAIWDRAIRAEVKRTMLSVAQINDLRSNYLVPGSELAVSAAESRIPMLIVQNPGVWSAAPGTGGTLGQGCGLDIILPSGWSMALWIALVYRCAQPAGLTELKGVEFERGNLQFPDSHPDSAPGADADLASYRKLHAKYCRMPPAKRCNHVKLGIVAPFHFPWRELVSEWLARSGGSGGGLMQDETDFYCLRNTRYLREVQQSCQPMAERRRILVRRPRHVKESEPVKHEASKVSECASHSLRDCDVRQALAAEPCLVPVRVLIGSRGVLSRHSLICIPNELDLHASSGCVEPIEPKHQDPSKFKKKQVSVNPEQLNKTVGNDAKDAAVESKKVSLNEEEDNSHAEAISVDDKDKKRKKTRKVSIECTETIPELRRTIDTSSRLVIGFVVEGGFSYAVGGGMGLGFVSLQGLWALLDSQKGQKKTEVLVRCSNSAQYRRAVLSVVL